MIIQFCGLSGVGKTTLAENTKTRLLENGIRAEIIDGDVYRSKLCKDLGFTKADRQENIKRLGFIASRFSAQGIVAIMSVINPYEETRAELVREYPNVKTIFLDCPIEVLYQRDTKGLYKRTLLADDDPQKIRNLTGINDMFERPGHPDLYINTSEKTIVESVRDLTDLIMKHITCQNSQTRKTNPSFLKSLTYAK
ncbi:adenylyl-sulfate kinase [Dyadobacter sp. CY356]|uniref:adenylyl-sulfate kinase n=1 Tax=Dyadobacter sp. CY356 TaxID=2906442 RepID=UPI001F3880BA|nr:adenylyl-sulfate kinase [Dyadobacter sp. CY356]MCF0055869.1 adenylyl-sulfate kinase [Dyadobacter sp. CY356]